MNVATTTFSTKLSTKKILNLFNKLPNYLYFTMKNVKSKRLQPLPKIFSTKSEGQTESLIKFAQNLADEFDGEIVLVEGGDK